MAFDRLKTLHFPGPATEIAHAERAPIAPCNEPIIHVDELIPTRQVTRPLIPTKSCSTSSLGPDGRLVSEAISMEDLQDVDEKRPRLNSYGPPQTNNVHRMPPADNPVLHNYQPPPPGPAHAYGHQSWAPPPSPYESSDQRTPLAESSHHQPNSSHPYPPREHSSYGPDVSYSRTGSISAPSRSPGEAQHPPHMPQLNGSINEGQYHPQQPPPDYRTRPAYGPMEGAPNGSHPPHGLHISIGQEMMSGLPSLPPTGHHGYPLSAGPGPQPSPSYPPGYYGPPEMGYGPPRRKPVRAAQACDSCRTRKSKCDEARPCCSHCRDNNLKCTYRDVPLQKQDKQAMAMTEKLESMDEKISRLLQILENQVARTGVHDRQLEIISGTLPQDKQISFQAARSEFVNRITDTPPVKMEASNDVHSNAIHPLSRPQEKKEEIQARSQLAGEFAFPVKHTTAAQNILSWPSIKTLIPTDHKDTYVMDMEKDRGLLRLYGCGEGEDKNDGGKGPVSPADCSTSSGRADDEVSTPSPGGVWGSGYLPPPSPGPGTVVRDHPGGVSPTGGLILDSLTVENYYKSYRENIHILHPFLELRVMRGMLERFKKRYSKDKAYFPYSATNPGKRKRHAEDSPTFPSNDSVNSFPPNQSHVSALTGTTEIERSITNAIILLVIALGKICSHKDRLPPAVSPSAMPTSTPVMTSTHLEDLRSAPSSPHNHSGIRSIGYSHASSSPADPRGRNMDVFPGLAYYSIAAGILGDLAGGSDLSHIQANLLAGLYMGQLARVFPSYHYISNASRACQVLIESYVSPSMLGCLV